MGEQTLGRRRFPEWQSFAGFGDEMPVEALLIFESVKGLVFLFLSQRCQKIIRSIRHFLRRRQCEGGAGGALKQNKKCNQPTSGLGDGHGRRTAETKGNVNW